jgi:hypothetical protein
MMTFNIRSDFSHLYRLKWKWQKLGCMPIRQLQQKHNKHISIFSDGFH